MVEYHPSVVISLVRGLDTAVLAPLVGALAAAVAAVATEAVGISLGDVLATEPVAAEVAVAVAT